MRSTVDLLILGAGWTSTFLIPLAASRGISHAATSRAGRDDTIPFAFDPHSTDPAPFVALPHARTVLITFPIKVAGASARLVSLFRETHPEGPKTAFVQLGSTGIWDGGPTLKVQGHVWTDRHSKFDETNDRANAETELLALAPEVPTTVLNLCGLWGGQRQPRNWVSRVAPSKEALKQKVRTCLTAGPSIGLRMVWDVQGSVHMMHGLDVSRAVLAVHAHFDRASGQRWLLTDLRVHDWWDLASAWGKEGEQPRWVRELLHEEGIRALPRAPEVIGRAMDSREFWDTFELEPVKNRLGVE